MTIYDKIKAKALTEIESTEKQLDILYNENVPQEDPINSMIGYLINHAQNMQDVLEQLQTFTKYTNAIRARFDDPKGPDYQIAFVSNVSEESIIQDIEDGECVSMMTLVVLIPTSSQYFVEDASGQPWKYAVAVNEHRELVD